METLITWGISFILDLILAIWGIYIHFKKKNDVQTQIAILNINPTFNSLNFNQSNYYESQENEKSDIKIKNTFFIFDWVNKFILFIITFLFLINLISIIISTLNESQFTNLYDFISLDLWLQLLCQIVIFSCKHLSMQLAIVIIVFSLVCLLIGWDKRNSFLQNISNMKHYCISPIVYFVLLLFYIQVNNQYIFSYVDSVLGESDSLGKFLIHIKYAFLVSSYIFTVILQKSWFYISCRKNLNLDSSNELYENRWKRFIEYSFVYIIPIVFSILIMVIQN